MCCSEINEVALECIAEERALLNNILREKANRVGHIRRRNCLLYDAIEGKMMRVKGKKKKQVLDDLRNGRRYWEIKEEAKDRRWKIH